MLNYLSLYQYYYYTKFICIVEFNEISYQYSVTRTGELEEKKEQGLIYAVSLLSLLIEIFLYFLE